MPVHCNELYLYSKMHELSIAEDILEIVKQNVPRDELKDIMNINVKIGDMSGVEADSLEFCFRAITSDTQLKNAKLIIGKVPFIIECNSCRKTSTNDIGKRICPFCSSSDTKVVSGLEMQVVDIELKTEAEEVT
jgi:hydrogenase nickel incorporation protein HypA/HybF